MQFQRDSPIATAAAGSTVGIALLISLAFGIAYAVISDIVPATITSVVAPN